LLAALSFAASVCSNITIADLVNHILESFADSLRVGLLVDAKQFETDQVVTELNVVGRRLACAGGALNI
jgi:hypothetical protein